MSSFHEALFPLEISLGAEGGPVRKTEIVALASGHEARNSPWAGSRRRYNAGYGVKSLAAMETMIAFFEARRGRLYGFRFRDPFDHQSCSLDKTPSDDDQVIGVGDGTQTVFQLVKHYESAGVSYQRVIKKPVEGSLLLAVNGVPQTMGAGGAYTLDPATGQVTFAVPPQAGAAVSAGFIFDTPVRFDTDALSINIAAYQAGDIPSIPLIEVLI